MYVLDAAAKLTLLRALLELWWASTPAKYEDIDFVGRGIKKGQGPKIAPQQSLSIWDISFYLRTPSPGRWLELLLLPYLKSFVAALQSIQLADMIDAHEWPMMALSKGNVGMFDYLAHLGTGRPRKAISCIGSLDLRELIRWLPIYACRVMSPVSLEMQELIAKWCDYAERYDWLCTLPRGLLLTDLADITTTIACGWKWEEPIAAQVYVQDLPSAEEFTRMLLSNDSTESAKALWDRRELHACLEKTEYPHLAAYVRDYDQAKWSVAGAIMMHYEICGNIDDWILPFGDYSDSLSDPPVPFRCRHPDDAKLYPRRGLYDAGDWNEKPSTIYTVSAFVYASYNGREEELPLNDKITFEQLTKAVADNSIKEKQLYITTADSILDARMFAKKVRDYRK